MIVLHETAEQFECECDNIQYRTKPIKTGGRFSCIACDAEVHEWRSYHDFTEWRAVNWTG